VQASQWSVFIAGVHGGCVVCYVLSGGAALLAADNSRLKEQAQRRRQNQARLPDSQPKATAADKPLFGPPIQVFREHASLLLAGCFCVVGFLIVGACSVFIASGKISVKSSALHVNG